MPLDGRGALRASPWGFELTLGPLGAPGRPRWRPSPPTGGGAAAQVRSVLVASGALAAFVVLPWAVRSEADGERLLALLAETRARPAASIAVPIAPLGYVADTSRRVEAGGYRRAAAGEPYLHEGAVDRLGLGPGDMVLLAPVPDRASRPWLEEMARLGHGHVPTVARAVASRPLAAALAAAGISHATGTVLGPPLRARLGRAGPPSPATSP